MNQETTTIAVRSLPIAIAPESVSPLVRPEAQSPGLLSDLLVLTKVRLTTLVLITTFVGFALASGSRIDWALLAVTLLGTALVAGASQTLNQVIEANTDRLMERTKDRPLPAGRIKRGHAFMLGVSMGLAGLAVLRFAVNPTTAALAGLTMFVYLSLYTPLKRFSPVCISIGAIAGAIPPVLGWAALRPCFETGAAILFAILFLWQMPHFLSLAWVYRDEYFNAGFVMLRKGDRSGRMVAVESALSTLVLAAITFLPMRFGSAGIVYGIGAFLCNAVFLLCAVRFLQDRSRSNARRLFFASILYLPAVLGLMVFG